MIAGPVTNNNLRSLLTTSNIDIALKNLEEVPRVKSTMHHGFVADKLLQGTISSLDGKEIRTSSMVDKKKTKSICIRLINIRTNQLSNQRNLLVQQKTSILI
jgi:hypothetical protein